MSFKVGDIVECIDDRPHKQSSAAGNLILGDHYRVTGTVTSHMGTHEITLDNGNTWSWYATRFKLADSSKYPPAGIDSKVIPNKEIDYSSITKDIIGG